MMPTAREAIRLEVDINGVKRAVAGVPYGCLDAMVTWVRRDPAAWRGDGTLEDWVSGNVLLSLGGIDGRTDEFVYWIVEQSLTENEEVTIRVLGPGPCDEPTGRRVNLSLR